MVLSQGSSHVSATPPSTPDPSTVHIRMQPFHELYNNCPSPLPENNVNIVNYDEADIAIDCTLPAPNWSGDENQPPVILNEPPSLVFPEDHSSEAHALMGRSVPHNTKRNSKQALKALGYFCVEKYRPHRACLLHPSNANQLMKETRTFLFPGEDGMCIPAGFDQWSDEKLKRGRHILIEFVANYKTKKNKQDLAPTTLKTYLHGIQRGFKHEWEYDLKRTSGPIFNNAADGLFAVADNKARQQQRAGKHVVSHNVLSRLDLIRLYKSKSLSRETPKGLQARVIFKIGILTAMRPSALATLKVTQFKRAVAQERAVWLISGVVGSDCGASKTERGGWGAIGSKVPEIPVYDEDYASGCINFFRDIDDYMTFRSAVEVGTDRFLPGSEHQSQSSP